MLAEIKERMKQDPAWKKILLIVLISAVAEIFLFQFYGFFWTEIVRRVVLISALIIISRIDYLEKIIPNSILIILIIIQALLLVIEWIAGRGDPALIFLPAVAGGGITLAVFLLVRVLSRGGIGMGDVKLCAVLGFYLGSSLILLDLLVCFGLSALFSIVQLVRKKLTMKGQIPFAPFICIGTAILLLIGF